MTTLPLYVCQWINSIAVISPLLRDHNITSSLGRSNKPSGSLLDLAKSTARPYDLVNALNEAASSVMGIEWPKPCCYFPDGSPNLIWYYSSSPYTWDPASEPQGWPWPIWISCAFLNGNLGWIEAVNDCPAYVKINIERDDLLAYFASDERRTSKAAGTCQALQIPIIKIDRLTGFDGKPEVELKEMKTCETSTNGNVLRNTQGKAGSRLSPEVFKLPTDNQGDTERESKIKMQGRGSSWMLATGKAYQITRSRHQENDGWFILDDDDYEESWERVSRCPSRCDVVVWDKLPELERNE